MTKLALVGEAWGEHEERERAPFVGPAGWELTKMLTAAEINRADCFLTNVFNLRPQDNSLFYLSGTKEERIAGYPQAIASYKGSQKKVWIHERYQSELDRLATELIEENPNIIVCLGNTPLWALGGTTGISSIRGTTLLSTHTVTGFKLLPTYHPAAVLRQWELRPTTVVDLQKALRESAFPEIRRPQRFIWIEPTLADLETFYGQYIQSCERLSVDIETAGNQITCIGFAPRHDVALVIPFFDSRRKNKCYWPDVHTEQQAWRFVKETLESEIPKVFQNGLFDVSFLLRSYGIRTMGAEHDTMLLHHALQPESLKSLGFLGSIYTDEGAWKIMRKTKTLKRDE